MCGIAGIISKNPAVVQMALPRMVAAQVHRGPDDEGFFLNSIGSATLGFGFRRLAILDLSPAGHQPMVHAETGNCLIFNGEIYNFRELRAKLEASGVLFRSQSDTEVVLQAITHWGADALSQFAGMFALAFYDARQQKLLLSRDPLGIKPLYVSNAGGVLVFASEVRALLASGVVSRDVDLASVAGCLAYGSVVAPSTVFQSIRSFPAGGFQWISPEAVENFSVSPCYYWSFPKLRQVPAEENVIESVRELVSQSVRQHLISDVPVGVFLSAGIDSTIIAGVAAKCTSRIRTFTVGFSDDPGLDESTIAQETASRIGSQHTEIRLTEADVLHACRSWLDSMDRPSLDGLNTYIISQAVRAEGIVVALSGLGGDELFAGYNTFSAIPKLSRLLRLLHWMPASLRSAISNVATIGKSRSVARKASDMAFSSGKLLDLYLYQRRILSDGYMQVLGFDAKALDLAPRFLPNEIAAGLEANSRDPVWTLSFLESRLYMSNTLLFDSDLNGMANSLEIRVPMLDRRVADYVYGLPGEVRMPSSSVFKYLLKQAFPDLLRPQVTMRAKSGFTLPIGQWLKQVLREPCNEAIQYLKAKSLMRPEGIDLIWNNFYSRREQWAGPFLLCILGRYFQKIDSLTNIPSISLPVIRPAPTA